MSLSPDVKEAVSREQETIARIKAEVGKVLVGQHQVLEGLLIGLLNGGHILLEGVPGLAKTTAVLSLARATSLSFQRLQFTPDLLPADLLGTQLYNPKDMSFVVKKGPIFANFILADEINRSPAKVQSALLEAMQERQVTIGDETFKLPDPFLVLATQNPIEQEGTYPLPEAQVDRFLAKLLVDYPSREEEAEILERIAVAEHQATPEPVVDGADLLRLRGVCRSVYLDAKVKHYILDIVAATRSPATVGFDHPEWISYGASPRAGIFLVQASRSLAFLEGRAYVVPHDVKRVAPAILRHRVLLSYEAEAAEQTPDDVVAALLERVPVP